MKALKVQKLDLSTILEAKEEYEECSVSIDARMMEQTKAIVEGA